MKKNEQITVELLNNEIAGWVKDDNVSPGAWDMFYSVTLKKLKNNYDITMQYLTQITKEQYDFVCDAIDEVVYHFQKIEMVELIENLYYKFYGQSTNTEFYNDNIKGLKDCIKKA